MTQLLKSQLISDEKFYEFLSLYHNIGNLSDALEQLGLTITQIFSKKESNESLELDFTNTHHKIENGKAFLARNELRNIMMTNINRGYIPSEKYIQKVMKTPDGEVLKIVEERHVSKNPLPPSYYSEFMQQNSITEAASVLAEHGLLPPEITRQIVQYQEQLSRKVKQSFNLNHADNVIDENELNDILKNAIA